MKNNLYIFSESELKRKDSTLCVDVFKKKESPDPPEPGEEDLLLMTAADIEVRKGEKKYYPVETVHSVLSFGQINFNTPFLNLLAVNHIPLHIFGYYGNYRGSFLPVKEKNSGSILTLQVHHYTDSEKRLQLAKNFVEGAAKNLLINIQYYLNREARIKSVKAGMENLIELIPSAKSVDHLLGIEGSIKRVYYTAWKEILKDTMGFSRRQRNPPPDPVNSLISFGNMVVYSFCLNEIYHTRLYPEVGFLHTTGDHKLSLCYDIAEIFKPIVTDRAVFKLINKQMISSKDFERSNGGWLLKRPARELFIQELDAKMMTVISSRDSGVNMSYRRLIRRECLKLIEHLQGEKMYKPFKARW